MFTHVHAMRPHTVPTSAQQRQPRQSVQAATIPDALLMVQTVVAVTGLSGSTIYRRLASGDFPQPIRMGPRCTRWKAADVTAWLRKQAAQKGAV